MIARQFMGHGCDRLGGAQPGFPAPEAIAQVIFARHKLWAASLKASALRLSTSLVLALMILPPAIRLCGHNPSLDRCA
jgi:hypothetical protein